MRPWFALGLAIAAIGCGSGSTPNSPDQPSSTAAVKYTIHGFIGESALLDSAPIAATIEVTGGPLDKQTYTADSSGRFSLPAVEAAGFSLVFRKEGYDSVTYVIRSFPQDAELTIALVPRQTEVPFRFEGVCPESGVPEFSFNVFHAGEIVISEKIIAPGWGSPYAYYMSVRGADKGDYHPFYSYMAPYRLLPGNRYVISFSGDLACEAGHQYLVAGSYTR